MPDFGLTKALRAAVTEGASKAKVLRPAEAELAAKAKLKAKGAPGAIAEPTMENVGTPSVEEPSSLQSSVDQSAAAPEAAPAAVPTETPAPAVTPPAEVLDDTVGIPQKPVPEGVPSPQTPVEPLSPAADTQANIDAFRLSRANLGDFTLDEKYQPNFDTITTTDDIKGVIADTALRNAGKIDEARRGTITNEQLKGLAGDLDVNEDVIKQVMMREDGGVLRPETILAARQVLNSSADRLKGLAGKIATGGATDLEKVQFARQIQFHNEYQTQFMGARAEAGRSLNAFSIPTGSDAVQVGRIAEILQNSGTDVDRLARAINMADTVDGVTKIARGGLIRRALTAGTNLINRVFVNGILSGPLTHMRNIGGNALFQTMNMAETAVAARLGRFLPGDEHVQVGEALATLQGTIGATQDAFRLFGRAMKTGQSLDGALKFEATGDRASTLATLPELDKPFLRQLVNGFDAVIGVPSRMLGAADDFFKTLAYRADLQRQTLLHVQDQVKSGKVQLADAAQTARDFMENTPEESQKAAEDWASQMTFQTPLGPTGQKLTAALRSAPILTLIAPFIRTPSNIFKESLRRSPLAFFSSKWRADVAAGGRARDLALSRFAMGSATSAMVANWAANGDITGGGPQQPEARALWMANGRRPYSIRVTNPMSGETSYHSYAAFEPIASVLGATADTVEINSYLSSDVDAMEQDDQSHTYQAAGAIVAGVMNNSGNKTFMKGISDFVEFMNDPSRTIQSYSNQMAVSILLPYSGLLRTIRNTQDPYLREAWEINDKFRDNIPGYSKDLPLRMDLFGEPREKSSSSLLGTMSPIPESPMKYDSVVKELTDVMDKTHQVPVTMPEKRIEGMRLNAREYSDLVKLSRSEPNFGGLSFHDKLDQMMNTSTYQGAEPLLRAELLKHIQGSADTIGRAALEKQNPDFADRITAWRMQKNRLMFDK